MEEQIKQRVEKYIDDRLSGSNDPEFDRLLESRPNEKATLDELVANARLVRETFRLPTELAPAPGFYARVMARIEEEESQPGFWSVFFQPFGQRLVYASAALILLMGVVMFSTPADEAPELAEAPAQMLVDDHPEVHLVGDQSEDRGRVFVNLTVLSSEEYQ